MTGKRPLAVPAIEDKLVQHAVVTILNQIYEEFFSASHMGFVRAQPASSAGCAVYTRS